MDPDTEHFVQAILVVIAIVGSAALIALAVFA
jgi:hypothetical protein